MVEPTFACRSGSSNGLLNNPSRTSFVDVAATSCVGEVNDIGLPGIGEGEGDSGTGVGVGDCGGGLGWGGACGMLGECWKRGGAPAGDGVMVLSSRSLRCGALSDGEDLER